MANDKEQASASELGHQAGLIVTDRGLAGRVIEVGAARVEAADRHAKVLTFIDADVDGPPGGRLLLLLVSNEVILDYERLKDYVGKNSQCYQNEEVVWIESKNDGGWTDRRQVSLQTASALYKNGGTRVKEEDWVWATRVLRGLHPTRPKRLAWRGFIEDARSWWYPDLPGPLVDHTFGLAPFQLLPRAALARLASGFPTNLPPVATEKVEISRIELAQITTVHSNDMSQFDGLVTYCGRVARSKVAKDVGRARILEYISQQIPEAAKAGRVQVIALTAIEHAIRAGGVGGEKWAPVTLYEYLRQGVAELVRSLMNLEIDSLDGEGFYSVYIALLENIHKSQRGKFEAFLLAFHRYLLILGFDHLPRALSGKRQEIPPCAAVVWRHELEGALNFIDEVASTPRIALQAKFCLVLGYHVPVRTVEPWCIRMCDVQTKEPIYLAIYTRERDGVGKVESLRRQEDIHDMELKTLLIDLVNMRDKDEAGGEDLLLGQPGQPDVRHAQLETSRLINDALRWAGGDKLASFYDLRHTAISNRARLVLDSESISDAMTWHQMAAQCGHAGPASSRHYIHQLEVSLANISLTMRPFAWDVQRLEAARLESIQNVAQGMLGVCPPLPPRMEVPDCPKISTEVDIRTRHVVAWRVAQGLKLSSIASELAIAVDVVEAVVEEIVQAMLLSQVVSSQAATNTRRQCMAISANLTWVRAASQQKYEFLVKLMDCEFKRNGLKSLVLLWQDWSICHDGDFISLMNVRPALRLVNCFLTSGVTKKAMIVSSPKGARSLSLEIERLGLTSTICSDRGGRADHRLFLAPRGVDAAAARGATISIVGVHWWMLVLGSKLIAMGEI